MDALAFVTCSRGVQRGAGSRGITLVSSDQTSYAQFLVETCARIVYSGSHDGRIVAIWTLIGQAVLALPN